MAGSLTERMMGAAMLNVATYEEVEADQSATGQAAAVVAIVAVCSAIGAIGDEGGSGGIIGALLGALLSWGIWAGVTYVVGVVVFGGKATWGELLRTLGFAQSPGVLNVVGIIPILGGLVQFVVWIWILVAGIVAIRQALDVSTGKAVLTALIAAICMVVVTLALAAFFGGLALLGGMFT
ncbi:MAG TPA: YIP1 family protein [Longimicrobiaceae bacterium]|nr:YIP1 family protein [Longimicrobiaceae bacterium]